jgi:hypothetical protein
VIRESKIRRKGVDLNPPARPSKIRRDPAMGPAVDKEWKLLAGVDFHSREWEIRFAVVGILIFALGISAVVIDVGEVLSHRG